MIKFYNLSITKQSIGTAIMYKEPTIHGKIITKVTDSTTLGNYKIIVVDCDEDQHKANMAISGVEEILEEQAVCVSSKYRPKRLVTKYELFPKKKEKITIPACDLRKFIKKEKK